MQPLSLRSRLQQAIGSKGSKALDMRTTALPRLKAWHLIVCAIFAFIILNIPWEIARGKEFTDKANYLNYFKYEVNILEYKELEKWYQYLTNEVLWHTAIPFIHETAGLQYLTIFKFISFFCVFTMAAALIRVKGLLSLPLLMNPLLITFCFDQMRNALAISLLLWAYMLPRKAFLGSILLIALAPLFHTSSVLFVALWLVVVTATKLLDKNVIPYFLFLSGILLGGIAMSFVTGEMASSLLSAVGDRRAERAEGDASSGVKYTLFWAFFLLVALAQPRGHFTNVIGAYSIVILSCVTSNLIFGGYSSRFLAASLPFLLISLLNIDGKVKPLMILAYVSYGLLQWVYWLKLR